MAQETKKTDSKQSSTTKKSTTKTTTKKPTSTVKKNTTNNAKVSTTKKTTSSVNKTTTKKPTTSKGVEALKSDPPKKKTVSTRKSLPEKTSSKSVKNDKKQSNLSSKQVKTTEKVSKPKPKARVKKQEELTTLEVLEQAVEHHEITEKKPLGKTFYLFFAIVVYAGAFFYINNIVYNNTDMLQSAIFAFAAVFILFVLMLFNVHRLVMNFFVLPFRRLLKQTKLEINKEIIFSVGKNKVQTTFNKYKSLFTLISYGLFAIALIYFSVLGSIMEGDKVLKIVTDAGVALLIFLVVICSWQYLFNIIPSVLDKSIDARNGFILTLSAVVLVIYIVFLLLDIMYLAEIMIFVLIIGFVALLGVNLNMIIGEINIFQNLRGRKSKAITRMVFIIFFAFHIYVILYASVVAYSIYNWEPDSFEFATFDYETVVVTDLYTSTGEEIDTPYYNDGVDIVPLTEVYDESGTMITEYIDNNLNVLHPTVYTSTGTPITMITSSGEAVNKLSPLNNSLYEHCATFYYNGEVACVTEMPLPHTYGDFLYWTVVTVSTIGYGDVHPSTEYNIAMGWGGFLGLYGLTFLALSISFVANIAMEGVNSVREENRKND